MDSCCAPPRSVLVMGATGFVGRHLIKALAASSELVPIALMRKESGSADQDGIAVRCCDARDAEGLRQVLSGIDIVVNAVGGSPRTMTRATEALCEAARDQPVKRIIHLSSIAVYGDLTGRADEDTEPTTSPNGYARAKQDCESTIFRYIRDGGDAIILRPGCIFGADSPQWSTRIARLLMARRIGDLGEAGDGTCNLIYIDDLARAVIAAMSPRRFQNVVFNLTSDHGISWNDFFLHFGRALDATPIRRLSSRRLQIEARVVAPILRIASLAARAVPQTRGLVPDQITPSLARLWRQDLHLDATRAASDLGLSATPLERVILNAASQFHAEPITHGRSLDF